jgi:hypothetical protein
MGGLVGAGACIIDPQFGSTVCRITDNNTNTPGAQVNSALLANDSGSGEMMSISCDDSLAMASNGGGSQFPLIFNPLGNVANARMYKTTDSATNGFVFTGGNFDAWSRICPANNQLAYVTVGSQLVSYNFNGYCDTCTPPNIAGTLIYDFASANGLGSNFHITFNTPGGISQGDADFIVSFGGAIIWTNSYSYTTGYANGVIAGNLVYPATGNAGGFIYEATNAPCTGQATGNPTWNQTPNGTNTDGGCTMQNVGTGGQEAIGTQYVMVWRNGSGVRTLNTVTGGVAADWGPTGTIPSWPCVMYTHEARIGKIGGAQGWTYWGAGSPCVPAEHYIWLYAASSLTGSFYASANTAHSGGHATEGMLFYINNVGNSVPDWMQVCYVYGSSNLCPATSSAYGVTSALPAPTGTPQGMDMHLGTNWLNDAMPVCASTTTLGTPPSPKAWQNEIMCFPTTYTAGVNPFRFASTENSSLSSSFYISNAIGSVSADGNWFLFTSDWQGTLGSSSGGSTCVITSTCRSDLFAVQLSGSVTPPVTPTPIWPNGALLGAIPRDPLYPHLAGGTN